MNYYLLASFTKAEKTMEYFLLGGIFIIGLIIFFNRKKGFINIKLKRLKKYKVTIINLHNNKVKYIKNKFVLLFLKIPLKIFNNENSYQSFLLIVERKNEEGHSIYRHHKGNILKAINLDLKLGNKKISGLKSFKTLTG